MAEIKIEKKKVIWLWLLLGFILVAGAIYFLEFYNRNKEIKEVPKTADLLLVKENNSTVAEFISFIEADSIEMSLPHTYTHAALIKLADATKAIATEVGYDVKVNLDKVKEYAEEITKKPFVNTHADTIRKATDLVTTVLQNIQQEKYTGLANEAAELKIASESINPDVLALKQKEAIKSFFRKAADLLKKMN